MKGDTTNSIDVTSADTAKPRYEHFRTTSARMPWARPQLRSIENEATSRDQHTINGWAASMVRVDARPYGSVLRTRRAQRD